MASNLRGAEPKMRTAALAGLGIGLAGAALDFVSGYSIRSTGENGMTSDVTGWTIPLYLLGIAVLASGVLIVLPMTGGAMRKLGGAMEVLGIVMVLVSYLAPGMNLGLAYAMLVVGAAMIVNGAIMQRGRGRMKSD